MQASARKSVSNEISAEKQDSLKVYKDCSLEEKSNGITNESVMALDVSPISKLEKNDSCIIIESVS